MEDRTPEKRAVSAVLRARDTGRVALVRRKNPPRAGEWSLPGGSVEREETPAEAIVRELSEELGIAVGPPWNKVATVRVAAEHHDYLIDVFLVEVAREIALAPATDAAEATWADATARRALGLAEDTAELIDAAVAASGHE
jgi:ADP-ribose pyrophosphatase YjhB (NUDIX family)